MPQAGHSAAAPKYAKQADELLDGVLHVYLSLAASKDGHIRCGAVNTYRGEWQCGEVLGTCPGQEGSLPRQNQPAVLGGCKKFPVQRLQGTWLALKGTMPLFASLTRLQSRVLASVHKDR